jgi:hypothetical protein
MSVEDFNFDDALKMKKAISLVLFALLFRLVGILISELRLSRDVARKAFAIEEPLLIEGERQNGYSVLPAGTVLYLDKSWPEGTAPIMSIFISRATSSHFSKWKRDSTSMAAHGR